MKDKFKESWEKYLLDAELQTPPSIWGKIEASMQQDLSFDKKSHEVFNQISIQPSEEIWPRIVAELEEDRKPFILIWLNKYASTAIAAMLVLFLGFSLNKSDNDAESNETISLATLEKSRIVNQSALSVNESFAAPKAASVTKVKYAAQIKKSDKVLITNTLEASKAAENFIAQEKIAALQLSKEITEKADQLFEDLSLNTLATLDYDPFGNSIILKRNKLGFETPEKYLEDHSTFLQRSWLGLISGLAPFSPNFNIKNFERDALVSASEGVRNTLNLIGGEPQNPGRQIFAIPLSQPYNNVTGGLSLNLGADYGKKISRHFSLQGGLRYIRGTSKVSSNVYSYNTETGDVKTFLESYYLQPQEASFNENTQISSKSFVSNNYNYVMMPLQIGFHIPLMKNTEAMISSGVSTDLLINNVIDQNPTEGNLLTPKNSNYNAVNLSAIGNIKLNYMLKNEWQISVGSNIQQSLFSGVDSRENFTFKPRYIGISYGINYRFN